MGQAFYHIFPVLAAACLNIGVLAVRQDGYKSFYRNFFSRISVGNMQFLTGKIYEKLLASFMIQLHRTFNFSVLAFIMLHVLSIAVRICSLLFVLIVMKKESKSRMITPFVYLFKMKHQLVESCIINGCMAGKKLVKGSVIHGQKIFKPVFAGGK